LRQTVTACLIPWRVSGLKMFLYVAGIENACRADSLLEGIDRECYRVG
jgi:hypothetical protein